MQRNDKNVLMDDLDRVIFLTGSIWDELRGGRIFLTGGTGFFGCWLLESFAWANERLGLGARAVVLSRNPEAFFRKVPHLYNNPAIELFKGDALDFEFPGGEFSHVIHGLGFNKGNSAGDSPMRWNPGNRRVSEGCREEDSASFVDNGPVRMAEELLSGTRRILEFSSKAKAGKFLLISTGAVYGPITAGMKVIPEDFSGSIDPASESGVYHHVRRMMESLCVTYSAACGFEAKIARCFSFLGPYLQLTGRFAVGDFIKDTISNLPITIRGTGQETRSYLYCSDLVVWLWTILFKGKSRHPYNVGSEIPTTIQEVANLFATEIDPPLSVIIQNCKPSGVAQACYVPDTTRALTELGLKQAVSLKDAVRKTLRWHQKDVNKEYQE